MITPGLHCGLCTHDVHMMYHGDPWGKMNHGRWTVKRSLAHLQGGSISPDADAMVAGGRSRSYRDGRNPRDPPPIFLMKKLESSTGSNWINGGCPWLQNRPFITMVSCSIQVHGLWPAVFGPCFWWSSSWPSGFSLTLCYALHHDFDILLIPICSMYRIFVSICPWCWNIC